MKTIKFLMFIIIMIIITSCTTTRFVQSSDDSIYDTESSFRLFNPLGYELYYSPIYGYHYYDPFRTRFLFDDFIYRYYPNFGMYRNGRYHWDCFSYQQNHRFDRIDRNRNFIQRYEGPNYSMKRGTNNGGYQRSESRQIQGGNSMRNQTQGSTTRQSVQRSAPSSRQQNVQRSTQSSRQQNVQRSTPTRSTYQRSPAVRQNVQRSTAPNNRGNSTYGRRR